MINNSHAAAFVSKTKNYLLHDRLSPGKVLLNGAVVLFDAFELLNLRVCSTMIYFLRAKSSSL